MHTNKEALRVPEDQKKANVIPVSQEGKNYAGNCRLVILNLIPGKVMEQTIPETISKHMKVHKVVGSSQHEFANGKSWWTNLIDF